MNKSASDQKKILRLIRSVEASEIGFWEWTIKRNQILWSSNVYKIFGIDKKQFDGTLDSYRSMMHPGDLTMIDRAISEAIRLKKNYTFQHRLYWPDRSLHWLEAMGSVVVDKKGLVVKLVGLVRDVTKEIIERKANEETIREQNISLIEMAYDLKTKVNQLEEFAYITSHNLKSPINNIVSLLDLLEKSKDSAELANFLSLMKDAATGAQSTLKEVSEMLVINQNSTLEKRVLSFEDIFQKVKSMLQFKINQISAEVKGDFRALGTIEYPKIYLESIFLNLMSNSLKYSRSNVKTTIIFKSSVRGGKIILECVDNGLGIDLAKHGNDVFKMNQTFHHHADSQGVGLFLIKNQVEVMGGTIKVESKINKGTKFTIEF